MFSDFKHFDKEIYIYINVSTLLWNGNISFVWLWLMQGFFKYFYKFNNMLHILL